MKRIAHARHCRVKHEIFQSCLLVFGHPNIPKGRWIEAKKEAIYAKARTLHKANLGQEIESPAGSISLEERVT